MKINKRLKKLRLTESAVLDKKNVFPLRRMTFASLALAGLSFACVTVNVNFPESVVQKAADDYVRDLYENPQGSKEKKGGQSFLYGLPTQNIFHLGPMSWFFSAEAQAAEIDTYFKTQTSLTRALQEKQRKRIKKIDTYKRQGVIGEDNRGLLLIKDDSKLRKLRKKMAKQLVEAENQDRQLLYKEVLKANQMADEKQEMLQGSFARSFQKRSPKGTWIQAPDGAWSRR